MTTARLDRLAKYAKIEESDDLMDMIGRAGDARETERARRSGKVEGALESTVSSARKREADARAAVEARKATEADKARKAAMKGKARLGKAMQRNASKALDDVLDRLASGDTSMNDRAIKMHLDAVGPEAAAEWRSRFEDLAAEKRSKMLERFAMNAHGDTLPETARDRQARSKVTAGSGMAGQARLAGLSAYGADTGDTVLDALATVSPAAKPAGGGVVRTPPPKAMPSFDLDMDLGTPAAELGSLMAKGDGTPARSPADILAERRSGDREAYDRATAALRDSTHDTRMAMGRMGLDMPAVPSVDMPSNRLSLGSAAAPGGGLALRVNPDDAPLAARGAAVAAATKPKPTVDTSVATDEGADDKPTPQQAGIGSKLAELLSKHMRPTADRPGASPYGIAAAGGLGALATLAAYRPAKPDSDDPDEMRRYRAAQRRRLVAAGVVGLLAGVGASQSGRLGLAQA